jgi:hypothetical protein
MLSKIVVGLTVSVLVTLVIPESSGAPAPEGHLTLMGMLSEWQYPNSKFHGATGSDAAITDIGSIKCKAVLTTTDPVENVVTFYRDKLKVDSDGNDLGATKGERVTSTRSVSIQDNSDGRPLKLVIIVVSDERSSTTLVVSRAKGEAETHIAWSHFRQVWPPR